LREKFFLGFRSGSIPGCLSVLISKKESSKYHQEKVLLNKHFPNSSYSAIDKRKLVRNGDTAFRVDKHEAPPIFVFQYVESFQNNASKMF
jgi:hypothetical protein